MVNHVKKSVTRDRIYALKSEVLIDRKLGKNANEASGGFNLCVFIRFPDLAFVKRAINKYGWLAIVVPTWNHEKNARVSDSERDEKSVSNNTPPQATVFWRFEVEKPSKKLIEIQQCYLETFGTIGPQDVSEADVQHFFCHVKSNAWYPMKWQIDKNSH